MITELRIGNYFYPIDRGGEVHLPATGTAYKVLTIGFDVEAIPFDRIPAQIERWSKFNASDLSGIPLTGDWLLKLGAKRQDELFWLSIANLKAELHFEVYDKEIVTTIKSDHSDLILDQIKYVHTLQNLYFALTGEELLLK